MRLVQLPFLFLSFTLNSCDTSKTKADIDIIKEIFENYKASTLKEDYEATFNLIYPLVFIGSSKKENVDNIRKGMHNSNYDIIISEIINDSIYQVEKYGSNKYSLIKATTKSSFYLKQILADSLAHVMQFNNMCNNIRMQLGEQNVTCNFQSNSIDILQKSNVYFIFDQKYKEWFLLSDDVPENVEKFVPLEVRRKFGGY